VSNDIKESSPWLYSTNIMAYLKGLSRCSSGSTEEIQENSWSEWSVPQPRREKETESLQLETNCKVETSVVVPINRPRSFHQNSSLVTSQDHISILFNTT
jgi:hypothetical protein